MAFLFSDSFDHYLQADVTKKWTSAGAATTGHYGASITAGVGRRGTAAFRIVADWTDGTVGVVKTLTPGDNTIVWGAAVQLAAVPTNYTAITQILNNAGVPQLTIRINATGLLEVFRGTMNGVSLGVTSAPLPLGSFTYLEVKASIHTTTGSVAIRFNGVPVLTLAGPINTAGGGTNGWSAFTLGWIVGSNFVGNAGYVTDYDDLYVLDGTGPAPLNTFLGDSRVDVRYPTGPGATTGWTPNTGANWDAVNDPTPDGDTTYVQAPTVGLTDTYVVQDAAAVGSAILAIQHCLNLLKTDAGPCAVAPVVRHAGANFVGAPVAPGLGYSYGLIPQAVNPGTGLAWVEADFNAAEFGVQRTI